MTTDRYPRPAFVDPLPDHFRYLGWTVEPPTRAPLVRRSARREQVLDRLRKAVRDLDPRIEATLFEAVLIPPLAGVPRLDVTLLVRASTAEAADGAVAAVAGDPPPDLVMPARNIRRIGDTGHARDAVYLFNHFTALDAADAVGAWEELTGWYTASTGVDNSTLLAPTSTSPFAFVNHVRLPGGAARFLLTQLVRPSFHTHVRPLLRRHGMVALPLLCRPA